MAALGLGARKAISASGDREVRERSVCERSVDVELAWRTDDDVPGLDHDAVVVGLDEPPSGGCNDHLATDVQMG